MDSPLGNPSQTELRCFRLAWRFAIAKPPSSYGLVQCETMLLEVWGRLGLDPSSPLITGTTQITFGSIVMAMAEVSNQVTVTRQ